jgi:RNA polymerase sigma factor (sigma-70 family)
MITKPDINEVVAKHGPLILRVVASYEEDPHRAADLAQETLIAVWTALHKFRGEASLRTFVARIAHNRCVSHVIREARQHRTTELTEELPSSVEGPEEAAIAADRRDRLLLAVRRLPFAYRAAVTLALEELSPLEIAEVLGLSANAVAIRLTRARGLLRKMLKDAS